MIVVKSVGTCSQISLRMLLRASGQLREVGLFSGLDSDRRLDDSFAVEYVLCVLRNWWLTWWSASCGPLLRAISWKCGRFKLMQDTSCEDYQALSREAPRC